ncbi:MAG: carboxypeptidase-like regulatory domain-containing protein, partial [Schleiferiaceae bacterium]|nr:carboxypeptidase-like regulatory domain-containing protein [Schleiferiaceae bacterium]
MNKIQLFCLIFLASTGLMGQSAFDVSGRVEDAKSGQVVPYAHIYIKNQTKGTVSDFEGLFYLNNVKPKDSIIFSFMGYEDKFIVAEDARDLDVFKLDPVKEVLEEVVLTNNDDFLYELLANCKGGRTKELKYAKSYFSLNTFIDSNQVELLECYFNGAYAGYNVQDLHLKNGRIHLEDYQEKFFVSLSTSRAIVQHQLFASNNYFPEAPFRYGRNRMEKLYHVHFGGKYKDDKERVIYKVKFVPKENKRSFFEGMAFVDSTSGLLLKTTLSIDSAAVHPFYPLWPNDSINHVSLEIQKTFEDDHGKLKVTSIDFNYALMYDGRDEGEYEVKTNAVLYAYKYGEQFMLPMFGLKNNGISDYRKITAAPYNSFFWKNINEFTMNNVVNKNEFFAKKSIHVNNADLRQNKSMLKKGFFEQPYVMWSEHRMHIQDKLPRGMNYEDLNGVLPSKRYNLKAYLYLDVNEFDGEKHFLAKAIYDPYLSFFHYPDSKEGDAFVNMFFDLYEIEKRKLVKDLGKGTKEDFKLLYEDCVTRAEADSRKYVKEVERAKDRTSLTKWNKRIKKQLDLDNMEFFGL